MAAIDLWTRGGRLVIASDPSGNISPAANALLPFIPILYLTSSAAGWDKQSAARKALASCASSRIRLDSAGTL